MTTDRTIILVLCGLIAGFLISQGLRKKEPEVPKLSLNDQVEIAIRKSRYERDMQRELLEGAQKAREREDERRHEETLKAINDNTTWQILNSGPQK